MDLITTRFCDHIDDPAAGVGKLGAKVVRLYFVLLDQVHAWEITGTGKGRFGIDAAVQKKQVLVRPRTIDRDELIVVLVKSRLGKAVRRYYSRNEGGKSVGIPAVQGQVHHLFIADNLTKRR